MNTTQQNQMLGYTIAAEHKTSHTTHLLLTFFTGGLWSLIWLYTASSNINKRNRIKKAHGIKKLETNVPQLVFALILITLLIIFIKPSKADVFKCKIDNKTVYQAGPCQAAVGEQIVPLKNQDPQEAAIAKVKFANWEAQQVAYKVAVIDAEKEIRAENDRRDAVTAMQHTANAQYQQAYQLQREANAQEARNRIESYGKPGVIINSSTQN